ncbi:hypothetical protein MZM54_00125 [[Brevibacterium] frigoritolerans]|nr:hypothetical protein [Peribacillus frigoritolerans]
MVYEYEIIGKETIEELATICVDTGSTAQVGPDWCNEKSAEYFKIFIDEIPVLLFLNSDRAQSIAKDINNYAKLIKSGEASPGNNKQQELDPFPESDPFDIDIDFDDELLF